MKFTDIFIKRSVLASVVSLLILLFGLSALFQIQVREFPKMENTVITITTSYPGADAQLIAGFITTPIESAVASAEGIDYMTSTSIEGLSTIICNIKLNFNSEIAFTDIMSKVSQVTNQLPKEAQLPVIVKSSDDSTPLMYISMDSDNMTPQQITDYATRVVQPQLESVDGVGSADILGAQTFSMRIFLNPQKMAALNVTPAEVYDALAKNNYQTAAGNTKGEYVAINITSNTDLNNVDEFKRIIVKSDKNALVRLENVSQVVLGSENYDSSVSFNGRKAVFIAISPTPTANPLTVIKAARKVLPDIKNNYPPSLNSTIVYDATDYIRTSIDEVLKTILEAGVIVIIVIFLFLGSVRSVIIPVITIPLSLIGVIALMLMLGYSINLLTLLALVLAIGLVVDDAIVVVENVFRHIEEGSSPFNAALIGAREIALPVIAMTITLAAVYAPIGFMGGLTGALFKEFAFTLACAVIISGIVALTLSPMMCSKILNHEAMQGKIAQSIDRFFNRLAASYRSVLSNTLANRLPTVIFSITVLVSLYFIYSHTQKETAPEEDQGFFMVRATAPQYASINYTETFSKQIDAVNNSFKEINDSFVINGMNNAANSVFAGAILKPWRKRGSQFALKKPYQEKLDNIAGLKSFSMIPPALPGGGQGAPVQFVIKSTSDFNTLLQLSSRIIDKALKSGLFIFLDNGLKFDKPQVTLQINREKASELGLDMQTIGSSISSALSGGYVNYFNLQGRSYQVIPQLDRRFRLEPKQLGDIYVRSDANIMVPLSTVASFKSKTQPNQLTHFQQLNSATISGVMMPGNTIGQGLAFLKQQASQLLPKGFSIDYAGQSRQFIQEGNALILAFFMAILVIYLVLCAQFESFKDPLTVLVSVPMSICGALIPLNLGLATINIYTQIGLITLIGLISKHGILIVDFANHLQINKGLSKKAAVTEAATIRLRPILMTTAAMVFGVLPLVIASGAGAVSRFNIGLVISTGMLVGTFFTLFVVPTMYTFFAEDHTQKHTSDS